MLEKILDLKLPIKIKMSRRSDRWCDAEYEPKFTGRGKLKSHKITIYANLDRVRSVETLIAHELIHAWQEEQGLTEIHGKHFKKWAKRIQDKYPELGPIYIKHLDVN